MKQLSALEKKRMGRPLVDSPMVMRLKRRFLPIMLALAKSTIRYEVIVNSACTPVPGKPIIYAMNHTESADAPIVTNSVKTDCYILAGKQHFDFVSNLFFTIHGAVYFDRADREEMAAAKEEICAYLNRGVGIIWAPEGTWNLSDSLPMLPMRWGIIDVARAANAQIIPVVLNYDREAMVCRVDWGRPIHGEMLNDKRAAIDQLRDCMASFRWEAWSRSPTLKRAEIDKAALRAAIDAPVLEYPPDDYEAEQAVIFKPATPHVEAFSHLAAIEPNARTAFLFNKRLKG